MQLDVDGIESLDWLAFDLGIRAFIAERVVWAVSSWNVSGRDVEVLGQGGMMGIAFDVSCDPLTTRIAHGLMTLITATNTVPNNRDRPVTPRSIASRRSVRGFCVTADILHSTHRTPASCLPTSRPLVIAQAMCNPCPQRICPPRPFCPIACSPSIG